MGNRIAWTGLSRGVVLLGLVALLQGCYAAAEKQIRRDFGLDRLETGTLLHQAAHDGDSSGAEALINGGADVNERNNSRLTPLHLAAARNRVDTARLLIDRGAEINVQDEMDLAPIHLATKNQHTAILELLASKGVNPEVRGKAFGVTGNDVTALHLAASEGYVATAEALIVHGKANSNSRSLTDRRTPLHYAAGNDHSALADLLVQHGAEVDARDAHGETPLHYAVREGAFATVQFLLSKGADVNAQNGNGSTPMTFAVNQGYPKIVELLRNNKGSE
jgi:ankyrin repeat protein